MMRIGLGQFSTEYSVKGGTVKRGRRQPPRTACQKACDEGRTEECNACMFGSDINLTSMYGAPPAPMYYYPPMGGAPALGQSITDSPWGMFAVGALTWAFFGPVIKGALGLSSAAASYGIERAHGRLEKSRKKSTQKRLPPPSGSDDDDED